MKKKILISLLLIIASFLLANIASAQFKAIVDQTAIASCTEKGDCFCQILYLIQRVAKMISGLTGALALIFLLYGGGLWIFSGGTAGMIDKGKKTMFNAGVGILLVLSAFTVVNMILVVVTMDPKNTLENNGVATLFGSAWNTIECKSEPILPCSDTCVVNPDKTLYTCQTGKFNCATGSFCCKKTATATVTKTDLCTANAKNPYSDHACNCGTTQAKINEYCCFGSDLTSLTNQLTACTPPTSCSAITKCEDYGQKAEACKYNICGIKDVTCSYTTTCGTMQP